MHEASLMNDLMAKIERVLDEQKAVRAVGVKVTLGALSHMSPSHFQEHFETATRGTRMAGARLDIDTLDDINDPGAQDILLEQVEVEME